MAVPDAIDYKFRRRDGAVVDRWEITMKTIKSAAVLSLGSALFSAVAFADFDVSRIGNDKYMANDHDGCVAMYDSHGERMSATDKCSKSDLREAEEEVDDFRHGRGNSSYKSSDSYHGSSHHSGREYYEVHRGSDNKLRLRSKPSESGEALVKDIRNGEIVRGVGNCEEHHDTTWCEVEYEGERGWAKKKYLRETSSRGQDSYSSGESYSRHHDSLGGRTAYGSDAKYSDLAGARASSADSALQDRGFRNVDSFKSGNSAYSIWYNRNTGQCIQMAVADGRADSIVDIKQHAKCH